MENILETEYPNCNPKPAHLPQSANPAIKPGYYDFSLEKNNSYINIFLS